MSRTLSPREVRQLKKDAAAFARKAKADVTYYYINHSFPPYHDDKGQRHTPLSEVVFEKPSTSSRLLGGNVPRWYGPLTCENAYVDLGPLYEDRNHRDIRGMHTVREWDQISEAQNARFLGSDEFAASVEAAASGTPFRATYPLRKQQPKPKKKAKASR